MKAKKTRAKNRLLQTGKKRGGGRPTIKPKDFKGRHPLIGSEERQFQYAMEANYLRQRGWTYQEIGVELAKKHNLEKVPDKTQVYRWITELHAGNIQSVREAQAEYIELVKGRAELIIRKLIPLALDDYVVERTQMIGGIPTPVIDPNVLKERVLAAAEIRKQHDLVMKAMGITKPQAEGEKTDAKSTQMFIIQTITNHIAGRDEKLVGDREKTVLELRAGDPVIDGL